MLPATGANSTAFTIFFGQTLSRQTRWSYSLSPEIQLLAALRFYAVGTFLEVVGDCYELIKTSVWRCVHSVKRSSSVMPLTFCQARSDGGTSRLPCHCGCPPSNWPSERDTYTHRQPISARPGLHNTYEHDNINDLSKASEAKQPVNVAG